MEESKVAENTAVVVGGNDWVIVAKKFIYGLLASFVSIGLPFTIEFLQNEDLSMFPTWFIAFVPVLVGILLAAQNAWVHRAQVVPADEVVTVTTLKKK